MSTFVKWLNLQERISEIYVDLILEEILLEMADLPVWDEIWEEIQAAKMAFDTGDEAVGREHTNRASKIMLPVLRKIALAIDHKLADELVSIFLAGFDKKDGMGTGLEDMIKAGKFENKAQIYSFIQEVMRRQRVRYSKRFVRQGKLNMQSVEDLKGKSGREGSNRDVGEYGFSREADPAEFASEDERTLEDMVRKGLLNHGIKPEVVDAAIQFLLHGMDNYKAAEMLGIDPRNFRLQIHRIKPILKDLLTGTKFDPTRRS